MKNVSLALWGTKFSRDIQLFGRGWRWLFELMPTPGEYSQEMLRVYGSNKTLAERQRREFMRKVETVVRDAIKFRDGSFFREFADWIEDYDELCDRERLWLLAPCFDWTSHRKQTKFFTCKELVQLAKERRVWKDVDERRSRTLCAQLGIRLKKDREGRPHKTRTN
ncbi:MAG: hypothetical protein HY674_23470 [Chloroflexi bacterium]|nr:hypothetical protein [Chloroflexota bacterium]